MKAKNKKMTQDHRLMMYTKPNANKSSVSGMQWQGGEAAMINTNLLVVDVVSWCNG